MRRRYFLFLFSIFYLLFSVLNGCARCVLMRSEYYDMTGRAFTAKTEDAEIPIYKADEKTDRPWMEIGVVKVIAQPKTADEALEEELKKRARLAGADALVDAQIKEDTGNKTWFCGRLMSTKRNKSATAKAVVFVEEEKADGSGNS
jgi:hypothetical protein